MTRQGGNLSSCKCAINTSVGILYRGIYAVEC
jgi:hypothetical protein